MQEPITVHHLTNTPNLAWKSIGQTQTVENITLNIPKTSVSENAVRFVCMSDTHSETNNFPFDIPSGDIFIHAGDFTMLGRQNEIEKFNQWLRLLPHKYKVVIAGNHELSFDPNCENMAGLFGAGFGEEENICQRVTRALQMPFINDSAVVKTGCKYLTNCVYLEDAFVEIYGIKIYGAPWQPEYGKWAFNVPRGEKCLEKWNLIPDNTDILITHGPPVGYGDVVRSGLHVGCVELLSTIQQRVKPKYHIFGHIHEGYGVTSDGTTTFINASTCTLSYQSVNLPIVFDVLLPPGVTKSSWLQNVHCN